MEPKTNSWMPQVRGIGEERFTSNGLRFATSGEALLFAADLQSRWMGCKAGAENRRAFPTDDPVTHAWMAGKLMTIEEFAEGAKRFLKAVQEGGAS